MFVLSFLIVQYGFSATIRVPQDHSTVQSAVNAAQTGDTVLVDDGHWRGVKITKGITLKSVNGRESTKIGRIVVDLTRIRNTTENGQSKTYYETKSDKTVIQGFTIKEEFVKCFSVVQTTNRGVYNMVDGECRYDTVNSQREDLWNGGGISITDSSVSIIDCEISGCNAVLRGGGISARTREYDNRQLKEWNVFVKGAGRVYPTLEIYRCDIIGNVVGKRPVTGNDTEIGGGGIFIGRDIKNTIIDSCRIIDNAYFVKRHYPKFGRGSAILIEESSDKKVLINNTIFKGSSIKKQSENSGPHEVDYIAVIDNFSERMQDIVCQNLLIFLPSDSELGVMNPFHYSTNTGKEPSYWIYNSIIVGLASKLHGYGYLKGDPNKLAQRHYIGCKFTQGNIKLPVAGNPGYNPDNEDKEKDFQISFNADSTYTIADNIPLVDAGVLPAGVYLPPNLGRLNIPETDFFGNPRVSGKKLDVGPIEFQFTTPSVPTPKDPPVDVVTEETDTPKPKDPPVEPVVPDETEIPKIKDPIIPVTEVLPETETPDLSKFRKGLVGAWTFDQVSGQKTPDLGPHQNHGQLLNGAKIVPGGKFGSAISLSGDNKFQRVLVPHSNSLDTCDQYYTAVAWVKLEKKLDFSDHLIVNFGDSFRHILNVFGTGRHAQVVEIGGERLNPTYKHGNKVVVDGSWHHLAFTYDGKVKRLYVDGKLDVAQPTTGRFGSKGMDLQFGSTSRERPTRGLLDEIGIFNQALTAVEIQSIMTKGLKNNISLTPEPVVSKPTEPLLMQELSVATPMGKSVTFVVEPKQNKKITQFTLTVRPENGRLQGGMKTLQDSKVTLTYYPDYRFVGTDSFKYTVSDGITTSQEIQVDITVKPNLQSTTLQFSKIESVSLNQSFAVEVLLDDIKDLAGWSFNLEYDPAVLSVESLEESDFLKKGGGTTFFQKGTDNKEKGLVTGISSAYLGVGGVSNSGNLLTINLKSIKDGEGYLRLKQPKFGNPQGGDFPIKVIDTIVTVSSVPPCDVNADGGVDIFDLILVAQLFGQKSDSRSDTNGDGEVNIFDLIVVAQCFGQGAAPSIVEQPSATFFMVKNWVQLAEGADDGSDEFRQGISMLKQLLGSLKPDQTVLMNNYPNPFNPETWIPYHLSQDSAVVISIYDTTGQIIRKLDMGYQTFGYYVGRDNSAYWDGRTESGELVSSGTYFYQLETDQYSETRKMVILK